LRPTRAAAVLVTGLLLCTAPLASAASPNISYVRVVNACTCGLGSVSASVGGAPVAAAVTYLAVSDFVQVESGDQGVDLVGSAGFRASADADLDPGAYYTLVATGEADAPLIVVKETGAGWAPAAVVLHVARSSQLGQPVEVRLDGGAMIDTALAAEGVSPPVVVAPGQHELELYSETGYLLGRVAIAAQAGQQLTVVLAGSPGGTPDLGAAEAVAAQGALTVAGGASAGSSAQAPAPSAPIPAASPAAASATTATSVGTGTAPAASSPAAATTTAGAGPGVVAAALPRTGASVIWAVLGLLALGVGACLTAGPRLRARLWR
jgi:S-DNA-T family DNA segregation ATPase FtsK/SpoIIIE